MAEPKDKNGIKMVALEPILHDAERIAPGKSFMANKKQSTAHLKNKTAEKAK